MGVRGRSTGLVAALALLTGALSLAACTPPTDPTTPSTQRVSITVTGAVQWHAEATVPAGTFRLGRSPDEKLSHASGRARLTMSGGEHLDLDLMSSRMSDGLLGRAVVRNHGAQRVVDGLLAGEPPVVRTVANGWEVTLTAAWSSDASSPPTPGQVIVVIGSDAPGSTVDDGSMLIEGGRRAVNHPTVDVQLRAPEWATRFRIGNDATDAAEWQPVVASIQWPLAAGDGRRTVAVQFSDDTSRVGAPISATVDVDTSPPDLDILSHADGQSVDLSDGHAESLAGSVTDVGSGLVAVTATAAGTDVSLEWTTGVWATTLGAADSGPLTSVVTATDVAGNTATTPITLQITLPSENTTVVRPTAMNLDAEPALLGALSDVRSDALVFAGDHRGALAATTVIVSSPLTSAPDGLLRRVVGLRMSGTDTIVETVPGDIFDVYAQLASPPPQEALRIPAARADAPAAFVDPETRCEQFKEIPAIGGGGSVGMVQDLPALQASIPIPLLGPSHYTATVGVNSHLAARLDYALDFDVGLGGVEVKQFHAIAGLLLCGDFTLEAGGSLEDALGPQFQIGEDDLKGHWGIRNIDVLNVALRAQLGQGREWTAFELPRIQIGPLPVWVQATVQPQFVVNPDLAIETSVGGTFIFGGAAGVQWDDGMKGFIDGDASGAFTQFSAAATAGIKFGGGPKFVLKVNEALAFDLVSAGIEAGPSLTVEWEGDRIAADSSIVAVTREICVDAYVDIHFKSSLNIGIPDVIASRMPGWVPTDKLSFKLSLLNFDVARAEWEIGCPLMAETDVLGGVPLSITTDTLDRGEVGSPYQEQLVATKGSSWSVTAGSLPAGLDLSPTGQITGLPTEVGTSTFTVSAHDAFRRSADAELTLTIGRGRQMALGGYHGCVIDDGDMWCWGRNSGGQLGNGTSTNSATPVKAAVGNVVRMALGANHTCAIDATGDVWCWGEGGVGQLGLGDFDDRPQPTRVGGVADAVDIAAGVGHTCALLSSGVVKCWGNNGSGQLGDGTNDERTTPTPAQSAADPGSRIIATSLGTCTYVPNSPNMKCWGHNTSGQFGPSLEPWIDVPTETQLPTFSRVVAGGTYLCAGGGDGHTQCWGSNGSGQLGDGTTTSSAEPVDVAVDSSRGIAAAGTVACALSASRGVACWGSNSSGQLGTGATPAPGPNPPGAVTALGPVREVATGSAHACAITTSGEVWCWGSGGEGRNGDPAMQNSAVPLRVGTIVVN